MASRNAQIPSSTLKTFIVEDNEVIRHSLTETLEELAPVEVMGYAEGAMAANDWFAGADGSWHLAIVDLFLANGNGLEVLQQIAVREPYQRVVVLSNYATPDIRQRCAALGADAVFDKSNELDALIDFCQSLPLRH